MSNISTYFTVNLLFSSCDVSIAISHLAIVSEEDC